MMRVIIFSTVYFPLVGGAEVAMREETDRMTDVEFDLICARVKPGLPSTERIGNITVHRCGFGHPVDKYLLPIFGVIRALRITRISEKGGRRWAVGGGTEYEPTAHRPPPTAPVIWSLMASYGGFTALAYTWVRPRTKMLLTLQEGDPLEHYAKRTGKLEFLHRKVFERADAVQAISTFLANWAVKMGFRGKPEVVPNGVDIARFTLRITQDRRREMRASFGFKDEDTVLVTASRLSLKNGIDDLIRSLTHLPANVKALIAGEGEDAEKLSVLVKENGLAERVVFLGKRGHEELPGILQSADVFVRASLSEGLGNSFLEAMACGLPIIGTPVGGIPDFLTDGETGAFCQPRDPESIAAAVRRIQTEPGLREKLIRQGEALVREKYGWEGIASRIKGMLEALDQTNA
jgi:glycosyltransferase involved in cell wall biosynthesis